MVRRVSKGERGIVGPALALVGVLSLLVVPACSDDGETCMSPRVATNELRGDRQADYNDRSTWTTAAEITADIPEDAQAIVGFSNDGGRSWFDSQPLSPEDAQRVALGIGPNAVTFSVAVQATAGSEACDAQPDATIQRSDQTFDELVTAGAATPTWP